MNYAEVRTTLRSLFGVLCGDRRSPKEGKDQDGVRYRAAASLYPDVLLRASWPAAARSEPPAEMADTNPCPDAAREAGTAEPGLRGAAAGDDGPSASLEAGGIVFSHRDGHVWVSWNKRAGSLDLGPADEVIEMMRDFLAQTDVGERLMLRRAGLGRGR